MKRALPAFMSVIPACLMLLFFSLCELQAQTPDEVLPFDQEEDAMTGEEAERRSEALTAFRHPVAINRAGREDLMLIPGMDPAFADSIVAFRDSFGYFVSVFELLSVPGATRTMVAALLPMLTFEPPPNRRLEQEITTRWALKKTFPVPDATDNSTGRPWKLSARYRASYGNWTVGLKAEKDAGEPIGGELLPGGFDFYSGYAGYRGNGIVRQVVLGDYRIRMGNGLLCNQSFSGGSDLSLSYHPHDHRIIKPHTSYDEYLFFRGVAAEFRRKPLMVALFASRRMLDGNITRYDSIRMEPLAVSSIQSTGLHSTPGELWDRHALQQTAFGGRIRIVYKALVISLNALHLQFDVPVEPSETYANRDKFRGNRQQGISLDAGWYNRWLGVTAEASYDGTKIALLGIAVVKAGDKTTLWFSSRWYEPGYQAMYASAPGRGTSVTGEQGTAFTVQYSSRYGSALKVRSDFYRILSTTGAPGTGKTGRQFSAQYSSDEINLNWLFRITGETSYENNPDVTTKLSANGLNLMHSSYGICARIGVQVTEQLRLGCRIDYKRIPYLLHQDGRMIAADLTWQDRSGRYRLIIRQMVWKADHYDLRMYLSEHEAPGAFGMALPYGTGARTYLLARWKYRRLLQVWLKGGFSENLKPGGGELPSKTFDISCQMQLTI